MKTVTIPVDMYFKSLEALHIAKVFMRTHAVESISEDYILSAISHLSAFDPNQGDPGVEIYAPDPGVGITFDTARMMIYGDPHKSAYRPEMAGGISYKIRKGMTPTHTVYEYYDLIFTSADGQEYLASDILTDQDKMADDWKIAVDPEGGL